MSPTLRKPLRDPRSGVALILVMVSIAFMAIIIVEVIAASRVDLRIAINARNRLQAQYLAQSSAKFQLLRLAMYQNVKNMGDTSAAGVTTAMIDNIWNAPMPPFPLDSAKTTWPGQLMGSITSEGSKIPINLLDGAPYRGSNEAIAGEVKTQLEALIRGMLETEEFDEKYRGLEPKDLIDPLIDWIDSNKDKIGGGDEDREYERLDPPYHTRNDRIPSLGELHLIQGWTDDLIRRIGPNLSVLNIDTKLNPNYVSLTRIKSWGPNLTDSELAYIDQKRRIVPMKSMSELETLIKSDPEIRGGDSFKIPDNLKDSKNLTARERVFQIEASGIVGNVRRNLRLGVIFMEEKLKTEKGKAPKTGKLLEPQVVFVEEYL
ncbi:MAG: hypothetical protein ABIR96_05745 [Bdellovibrionota bacterium]